MGQKVSPTGFRLNVRRTWEANWVSNKKSYPTFFYKNIQLNNFSLIFTKIIKNFIIFKKNTVFNGKFRLFIISRFNLLFALRLKFGTTKKAVYFIKEQKQEFIKKKLLPLRQTKITKQKKLKNLIISNTNFLKILLKQSSLLSKNKIIRVSPLKNFNRLTKSLPNLHLQMTPLKLRSKNFKVDRKINLKNYDKIYVNRLVKVFFALCSTLKAKPLLLINATNYIKLLKKLTVFRAFLKKRWNKMFLFQFKAKRFINKVQKVTKILILISRVKNTFDKKKGNKINSSLKTLGGGKQILELGFVNIKKFPGFGLFQRDSSFLNYLSADLIALYFKNEMEKSYKKKDFFFKQGPKKGVEKFLRALNYRRRKNQIISGNLIGILVAINGRWSKTKNGRSQELKFSFGRVQKSKLVSFSQHAYSCGKTKFGAFNVSVILCLKKTI